MGSGTYTSDSWNTYATSTNIHTKSVDQIFTQKTIAQELDPARITLRESRDSTDNPLSTPVIVGLDVTGSMGMVLGYMAKKGLNDLMTAVYDHQPITNPHVMAMAIGDIECDKAPLQVTQFEADIRIAQQLERLFIEKGGGGNNHESYTLPWYFAAHHTVTDSFEKRGKKGFLFTVGDEMPNMELQAEDIARVFQAQARNPLDAEGLLELVSEKWEVYHLIVGEGSYAASNRNKVRDSWADLLGHRAIWLKSHRKMAEAITAILAESAGDHQLVTVGASEDHFIRAIDLS